MLRLLTVRISGFLTFNIHMIQMADARIILVWSFGMLLVELVTLRKPYPGMTADERAGLIKDGTLPPNIPPESPFKELIAKCCAVTPASRPTATQLMELCAPHVPAYLLQA
jgi:serine/threonine protein kinase